MNKLIKKLQFLGEFVEDFLIILGLLLIVMATFRVNEIAAIFVLGFIFLIIGIIRARRPPRRG